MHAQEALEVRERELESEKERNEHAMELVREIDVRKAKRPYIMVRALALSTRVDDVSVLPDPCSFIDRFYRCIDACTRPALCKRLSTLGRDSK